MIPLESDRTELSNLTAHADAPPEPRDTGRVRHSRRQFHGVAATSAMALALPSAQAAATPSFKPNYILGSCMYGTTAVAEIMPEVAKTGATAIDLWPRVHGSQREEIDEMGEPAFRRLMEKHDVRLGCLTQYKLGPFRLQDEMRLAQRMGCETIVTGGKGPVGLSGGELKRAVANFIEKMKPHLAVAEETGVTIAIENHGNNLVDSPDSLKWLAELAPSRHLGIALAPYHLPQDEDLIAELIGAVGNRLAMFYAWQHGEGCMTKLPKEKELLQMPGRGDLDFTPLMSALAKIDFQGWTEVFMHPVPRGIPILETTAAVTSEINRGRDYLKRCIANNG